MVNKITKNIYSLGNVCYLSQSSFRIIALSRGAIIAIVILDIWLFKNIREKKIFITMALGLAIVGVILFILKPTFIEQKLEGRPGKKLDYESASEEAQGRVFSQIKILHGVQFIVGRGAGAIRRETGMTGQRLERGIGEVHNLFGDIFRSYGLIGLALSLNYFIRLIWSSRILPGGLWVWAAIMSYNMSHNGMRFGTFWVLMALMICMVSKLQKREDS